jgi:hypothetical protein
VDGNSAVIGDANRGTDAPDEAPPRTCACEVERISRRTSRILASVIVGRTVRLRGRGSGWTRLRIRMGSGSDSNGGDIRFCLLLVEWECSDESIIFTKVS